MNIILLPSTTAAANSMPSTCEPVWFGAPGKRQRVTEAKGVALLCCVSGKRPVSSTVSKTR